MDLVYVCRDGDNEELRFSIRSAVANLNYDNLWVVGGKPDWYVGNYIEIPQKGQKLRNTKTNLDIISESDQISDDFILMNDDFFIMQPVADVGTYYSGTLRDKIRYLQRKHGRSTYIAFLQQTYRVLHQEYGVNDPLDYALHIPFKMNRANLREMKDCSIWGRNAYGNIHNIGGTLVEVEDGLSKDVKIYVRGGQIEGKSNNTITDKFLSTHDESFFHVRPMLEEMFPDLSEHEKSTS